MSRVDPTDLLILRVSVCSYQPRAENRKELGKESRSMTPWQPFHRWGIIISLPAHINSHCCFLFDSISIVTTDLLFVRGQSFLDNCLLMVQHQWQCSAVWKLSVCMCVCVCVCVCVYVRVLSEDKAKGDASCVLFLRGNNHWNCVPFSHQARDFHIHDRGADLGIVTVTVCPCARTLSYISPPFPSFTSSM